MQEFDIADTWIGPGRYYLAVAKNSGAAGNIHNHYWSAATPQGMWAAFGVSMMAAAFPLPARFTFTTMGYNYCPIIGLTTGPSCRRRHELGK